MLGGWVKTHYTRPKLAIQSPFLSQNLVIFLLKHLNGVEVHIFFPPFPGLYHHNYYYFLKPIKIGP